VPAAFFLAALAANRMRKFSFVRYLIIIALALPTSVLCQQPQPRESKPAAASIDNPASPFPIIPSANDRSADHHTERSESKYANWLGKLFDDLKITDIVVAFFTFVLALYTARLWKSTEKLWKAGEKALEITERAFVYIDGFNYELTTAADSLVKTENMPERYRMAERRSLYITRFACQPRWKNSGTTPTRNMKIRTHWRGPIGPVPPEYVYPNGPSAFFIGPNSTEYSEVIDLSGAPQALVDYGFFNPGGIEPLIFIWGRADYEDSFGHPHFVEWCYRLRLERHDGKNMRAQFIQWGDYNRTD
jgi:hypothetical protein